jgi:hypothetical protein
LAESLAFAAGLILLLALTCFLPLRFAHAAFNFAESLALAAGLILRFLVGVGAVAGVEEPSILASWFSSLASWSLIDAA